MFLKLNFKLAQPLKAFYWAFLSYEKATRRDIEVTKNSKLKNRLIAHRFFTADFRSYQFFWGWPISIRKIFKMDSTTEINYQQHGSFFRLKYTIYVLSFLLLRIGGGVHCELQLTSEHCYNIVRNVLILNMTKSGKQVFRLSDLQTVVQQKLVSTIPFYRDVHI